MPTLPSSSNPSHQHCAVCLYKWAADTSCWWVTQEQFSWEGCVCCLAQPVKIPLARAASGDAPVLFTWLLAGLEGLCSLACVPGEQHCCWQAEDTAWLIPSFEGFCLIKDLVFTLANQGLPRSLSEMSQGMVSRDERGICFKQAHCCDVCLASVTKS